MADPLAPVARLTAEERATIAARAEAATPGPWEWYSQDEWTNADRDDCPIFEALQNADGWIIDGGIMQDGNLHFGVMDVRDADADFIAAAREDVPALLATLAAVEAENARLRAGIAELRIEHSGGPDCSVYYCNGPCNCGADEHNARIDALLAAREER